MGVRARCMTSPLTVEATAQLGGGRSSHPRKRAGPRADITLTETPRSGSAGPSPAASHPLTTLARRGIFSAQQEVAQRKGWAETHYVLRAETDYTKNQMWKVGHWHVQFKKTLKIPCRESIALLAAAASSPLGHRNVTSVT